VDCDLLIRGGMVVDGTGMPRRRADVAVRDGRIARVSHHSDVDARVVVDADGLVVAPGFVDPHTHLDPQLCWDPLAAPSVQHGVTTVLTGNCSVTLAPCREADRESLARLFYLVEEVPLTCFRQGIEWTWETFGEFLDSFDCRLGVNVAALVGHSALRYYVMGPASYERAATDDEIGAMREVLRASMLEGAVGFSTSRLVFHVGEGGRPIPSRMADDREVEALCGVLGELGAGIFETDGGARLSEFPSHVRELAGPIAERTGCTVLLGGTVQEWGSPETWRDVYTAIDEFQGRGARIFTQVTPCAMDLFFSLEDTIVFADLPAWSAVMSLPRAERLVAFRDPEVRDALHFDAVLDTTPCFFSRRWETVIVTSVPSPGNRHLVGKSIRAIAEQRGARVVDTLLDLALEEDLGIGLMLAGSANGDDEAVATMLRSPQSIVGSSDAGAHVRTLCGAGDTSLLLSKWVREVGALSLEEAVRAITFDPATVIGLRDRGLVRAGYAADLVVFDPDTIVYLPARTVHDLPGGAQRLWRDPQGIHTVIVNGEVVVDADGQDTGARPGRVLRGADLL
jgi:N-acyl-D-aspartate/D-glutamate deacylase